MTELQSELPVRNDPFWPAAVINAPAAFIHTCQPTVATKPPTGPGWAHELKHDGYRLQIHVRDGRVRLYTMNGAGLVKALSADHRSGGATQRFRDIRCRGGLA